MEIKITFQHMDHSDNIEEHARQKLAKIVELFKNAEESRPMHVELFLKASKIHAHHHAELHLRTKNLTLNAHDESPDMYISIDNAIDKLIKQIVKQKEIARDKNQKKEDTEKNQFRSDKYKL